MSLVDPGSQTPLKASISGKDAAPRKVQRVVTKGGIEAWLVEEYAVPLIAVEFAFRGGAAHDKAQHAGASRIFASLLDEGAGPYDSEAFQEQLAEHAIELSFNADRDAWRGSLKTLARNKDRAFELLRLAVVEPRFDDSAVERVREQVLAGLRHEANDPDALAAKALFATTFGDHPYGLPVKGTVETVPGISRDIIAGIKAQALTRGNLVISVVGAIDADTLAAHLDAVFGDLPATSNLQPIAPATPLATGGLDIIDVDVPQTSLRFAVPGLLRNDPDFIAAIVFNHILGGGAFTSRLFQEVREKRGLAYGVSTSLATFRAAGLVVGGTATKNERAAESLTVIREEIAKLVDKGPDEDELARARQYLVGSYPLQFDSSSKIARQLLQIALDDLGIDYIDRRNGLIEAVTLADIRRVGNRLFGESQLLVVAAGRPEGLA
ncbi:M16 family metallopeptidase [Pseudochelatococcus contaminans]|uniref:Zinc protease n=1 Tax=Pseudochelatococcus contaminans TaxID=1538103 RepID=A0A7W5Z3J6_9HYPH|nr:pitrilysin family protein [Pseudochelatococcus contaminans]MBB3809483.1 zinc protease [Pseudochelatococcus contaminans]